MCPSQLRSSIFWLNLKNLGGTSGLLSEHRFGRVSADLLLCKTASCLLRLGGEPNRQHQHGTHQQPNRHHIPFEMHRARPGQVNLSFTETRWETCNNNDNTSLTSLFPGLPGTFKIDNLIIYSPPGQREHLRACGHVVKTYLKARAGPAMEHRTWKSDRSGRNTTRNLPGENIFTSSTSANLSDQMFWNGHRDTRERERKKRRENRDDKSKEKIEL